MLPYSLYRVHGHRRHQYTVIPLCIAMLVVYGVVTGNHLSDTKWTTQELRVEFRDPTLRKFSGCYKVNHDAKSANRRYYNSHSDNSMRGVFAYCREQHHWVLFENEEDGDNGGANAGDPCFPVTQLAYSAETDTFDIWSSFDELVSLIYFIHKYIMGTKAH